MEAKDVLTGSFSEPTIEQAQVCRNDTPPEKTVI